MPAPVLTVGATVLCQHGGQAVPVTHTVRVLVSGQPAVAISSAYTVMGCPFVPPAAGPCVSAQFVTGAARVLAGGVPLLLQTSTAVCVPTGTGLQALAVQTRVVAT